MAPRKIRCLLGAMLLLALSDFSSAAQPSHRLIARKAEFACREKMRLALETGLELHFDNLPLNEIIDEFKKRLCIEIQLDQRALEAAGVGFDTPTTYDCSNKVSAGESLRNILQRLDLVYIYRQKALLITEPAEAKSH